MKYSRKNLIVSLLITLISLSLLSIGGFSYLQKSQPVESTNSNYLPQYTETLDPNCQAGIPKEPIMIGFKFNQALLDINPRLMTESLKLESLNNPSIRTLNTEPLVTYIQTFNYQNKTYIRTPSDIFIFNQYQEYEQTKLQLVKTCERIDPSGIKNNSLFRLTSYVFGQYNDFEKNISEVLAISVFETVKSFSDREKNDTKYISFGIYDSEYPILLLPTAESYSNLKHFRDLVSNSRQVDLLSLFNFQTI